MNKRRARLRNDIIELTVFLHGYWDRVEAYLRDSNGEGINVQECKNLLNSSVGSRVCRSIGNNFEFNIKVAFQSTRIVKYSLKTDYEVFFKEIPGWDHQWGRAEGLIFGSGSAVRLGSAHTPNRELLFNDAKALSNLLQYVLDLIIIINCLKSNYSE